MLLSYCKSHIFTAKSRRSQREILLLIQSGDGDLPARSRFGEGRLDQKLLPLGETLLFGSLSPPNKKLTSPRPLRLRSKFSFGRVHPFHILSAAANTASIILVYPVQRHKLPQRYFLTCSSVGFGFSSSSAFTVMIIPGVQYPH